MNKANVPLSALYRTKLNVHMFSRADGPLPHYPLPREKNGNCHLRVSGTVKRSGVTLAPDRFRSQHTLFSSSFVLSSPCTTMSGPLSPLIKVLSAFTPAPVVISPDYDGLEYRWKFFTFRPARTLSLPTRESSESLTLCLAQFLKRRCFSSQGCYSMSRSILSGKIRT